MTSARIVSLNGGVYSVKKTPDEILDRLMEVVSNHGIYSAARDILYDEILPLLQQGEHDTKALEIAAKILARMGHTCPEDVGLIDKTPCNDRCTECWLGALRQQAGEAA
jgi:hypothetical protein